MKIKKFLEKVAEEDRESLINDKDIEFLASIGVDYEKKREAAKKEPDASYYLRARAINYKALLTSIACFLVVAITVITLSLYFSLKPSPVELPPIQYFEDNFVEVDSNLQELNDDLQLFTLTIDVNEFDINIKRTYDSLSSDNIYYTLDIAGQGKKCKIKILVKSSYSLKDISYTEELKEEPFGDYIIKYYENSQPMSGTPFVNVNCKGEIQIGNQSVYITEYEEMAFVESTFIETMQSIIKFN